MDGEGAGQGQEERLLLSPQARALRLPPPGTLDLAAPVEPVAFRPPAVPGVPVRSRFQSGGAAVREAYRAAVDLELDRGAAFLMMPVLFCIGAAIYFALAREPALLTLSVSASVAGIASFLGRANAPVRYLALACLLVLGGMLAGKIETLVAGTKVIGGEISTRLTGRVEAIERRENGRIRLTLSVLATERPKLRYQPDRVRVTARAVPAGVRPGSVVEGVVRLLPPLGPLRPGSYDFAFESYFDRLGANGFFLKGPELSAHLHEPTFLGRTADRIEAMRNALAERIRGHIGGPEGEIAAALVAGVRAGIPEEANEALRITGLAHVLSISGLHMALVAGVVIGSLRAGFALFPGFASRHPVRKFAAGGALVALAIYLLVSGAEVAAQRSFLMIAVMLVALMFDRAALTMRNLAIAAMVILVVTPHEAVGPSFQMSFAATAALIAAYGWWAERREGGAPAAAHGRSLLGRVLRLAAIYVIALAATSIVAGAATGIFGAWHFQRVSPLGLVANLLAMPIFSLIVMPFAVFGMVLMPFGLDGMAFSVMGQGLTWALAITAWLAERTPLDAIGVIPLVSVILLALALVPLTVATTMPMRLLALPLLAVGIASIGGRQLPDGYVSEDARLVGLRTADGRLAVNRARTNAFTVEDWSRALVTPAVLKPEDGSEPGNAGFTCTNGLCLARHSGGAILAHADTMPAAERACGVAALIIIADATAANPCPHSTTRTITARHLALNGSAELRFDAHGDVAIRQAIGEAMRPWHDHRRFSRAARGIAPYKRPEPPPADSNAPGSPAETGETGPPHAASPDAERPNDFSISGSARPAGPAP
jgi:ComEC/Rec2-related protein